MSARTPKAKNVAAQTACDKEGYCETYSIAYQAGANDREQGYAYGENAYAGPRACYVDSESAYDDGWNGR